MCVVVVSHGAILPDIGHGRVGDEPASRRGEPFTKLAGESTARGVSWGTDFLKNIRRPWDPIPDEGRKGGVPGVNFAWRFRGDGAKFVIQLRGNVTCHPPERDPINPV